MVSARREWADLAAQLRGQGRSPDGIARVLRERFGLGALASLRHAHSWSQAAAAEEWNRRWPDTIKTYKDFSDWETGRYTPSLENLDKLAQLYSCDLADLLADRPGYRGSGGAVSDDLAANPPKGDVPSVPEATAHHLPRSAPSAHAGDAGTSSWLADGHRADRPRGDLDVPGRSRQIRRSASPAERAFFGLGPVTVAVPLRQVSERMLPVLSWEDDLAYTRLIELLFDLSFRVMRLAIPPDGHWDPPDGDVVTLSGPLTSKVTAEALASDPVLAFGREPGTSLWTIRDRESGRRFVSPIDQPMQTTDPATSGPEDFAYVGRLAYRDRSLLVIAGVHAIGTVGAVHYLTNHLPELHARVDSERFSMVLYSEIDGDTVVRSELVCPRTGPMLSSWRHATLTGCSRSSTTPRPATRTGAAGPASNPTTTRPSPCCASTPRRSAG